MRVEGRRRWGWTRENRFGGSWIGLSPLNPQLSTIGLERQPEPRRRAGAAEAVGDLDAHLAGLAVGGGDGNVVDHDAQLGAGERRRHQIPDTAVRRERVGFVKKIL